MRQGFAVEELTWFLTASAARCKQVIGPQGVEDLMQALFVNQGAA